MPLEPGDWIVFNIAKVSGYAYDFYEKYQYKANFDECCNLPKAISYYQCYGTEDIHLLKINELGQLEVLVNAS